VLLLGDLEQRHVERRAIDDGSTAASGLDGRIEHWGDKHPEGSVKMASSPPGSLPGGNLHNYEINERCTVRKLPVCHQTGIARRVWVRF
jgi:hypothetical protein